MGGVVQRFKRHIFVPDKLPGWCVLPERTRKSELGTPSRVTRVEGHISTEAPLNNFPGGWVWSRRLSQRPQRPHLVFPAETWLHELEGRDGPAPRGSPARIRDVALSIVLNFKSTRDWFASTIRALLSTCCIFPVCGLILGIRGRSRYTHARIFSNDCRCTCAVSF